MDQPTLWDRRPDCPCWRPGDGGQCSTCGEVYWDENAHARKTDPGTSHAAAQSVKRIRDTQWRVYWLLSTFGPMTDEELAAAAPDVGVMQSVSGLRTRRSELVRHGWVRDTGARRHTIAGRKTIVWEAIPGMPRTQK